MGRIIRNWYKLITDFLCIFVAGNEYNYNGTD